METIYDVDNLSPQTRAIVEQVADIYIKHTELWFIGLVVHGSAVKGGFIPGSSDIDFVLYVEDKALNERQELPLSLAMAIHRELAKIDITPFRYIQFRVAAPSHSTFGNVIPGTYRLVAGRLLQPELSNEQLLELCSEGLTALEPDGIIASHRLLDHGEGRLQRIVRGLCTEVYPVLFQILTIQHGDACHIWNLNKFEAVELLPQDSALGNQIRRFYSAVRRYYPTESNVDDALDIIEYGVGFLKNAKRWWVEKQRIS